MSNPSISECLYIDACGELCTKIYRSMNQFLSKSWSNFGRHLDIYEFKSLTFNFNLLFLTVSLVIYFPIRTTLYVGSMVPLKCKVIRRSVIQMPAAQVRLLIFQEIPRLRETPSSSVSDRREDM